MQRTPTIDVHWGHAGSNDIKLVEAWSSKLRKYSRGTKPSTKAAQATSQQLPFPSLIPFYPKQYVTAGPKCLHVYNRK